MPSTPDPSASVILLDEQQGGEEPFGLFLLQRGQASRFMPGRYVFPGGRLESWDGPDGDQARRICALRELFEEAGVLLANGRGEPPGPGGLEKARAGLQQGEAGLQRALEGLGLSPAPESLAPYSRWITPKARSRRFDTTFYLARMPQGQKAQSDHLETVGGVWLGPEAALAANQAGEVSLAPPQVRILGELALAGSLEELMARQGPNHLEPIKPVLWPDEKRRLILMPWDPDYPGPIAGYPEEHSSPCHAGQASRLIMFKGYWLPYAKAV